MASRYYDNRGKREWWSVHVEAWQRSGLSQVKYCTVHGLERGTFARWLNVLTDAKMAKLRVERATLERKRARNKKGGKLTTDRRNRAAQAFWAMHVEALNWSGMSVREYAKALGISQFSLRRWRDLIADEELVIDWRAQLHASARPQISSGASSAANGDAADYGLTEALTGGARSANRRSFTDEEKRMIVLESEVPGTAAAEVCRRHNIVTSMLFRWRVQLGYRRKPAVTLATVTTDGMQAGGKGSALVVHDLLPVPGGMVAVELPDGRRVFAAEGADPEEVRGHVAAMEAQP